jgi:hypothetical protein
MLCAVINKLVSPGLSRYILFNKRETLICCRQTFPNSLIAKFKCQN